MPTTNVKPILFSAPMIRALLDGRKTQTRRAIKIAGRYPDFCGGGGRGSPDWDDPTCWGWDDSEYGDWVTLEKEPGQRMGWRDCRASIRAGDRLWVKETWSHTGTGVWNTQDTLRALDGRPIYRADGDTPGVGWFPSIFMFRQFSRLTLTVTDVRVQRLQEIYRGDAMSEGCPFPNMTAGPNPIDWFRGIWDSLNGERGFGWDANPWVAAYTFTVHRCNVDQMTATTAGRE